MSQNLVHAQPIQGCFPDREIRTIHSLQLAEVARVATQLQLIEGVKEWFADYLVGMITRKNG